MKVSVRLPVLSDEEIIFRKQIGVECVDLYLDVIPGYQKGVLPGFQTVRFDLNDVAKVIRKVKDSGLDVASFYALPVRQALLGHPEGEKQIEDLCEFIRLLGNESVEVAQVGLEEVRHGPTGVPGRYVREHRAGYKMYAFSLKLMREELAKRDLNACWAHHFRDSIKSEEYFSNCVKVLERVIPVAEDSNVKVAIHTDDPPVPDSEGLLPGITNPLLINRLFEAVPSKSLGLLFCCGTRYESGIDIYEQISLFGRRGKIFHVHFRNVRGTIPDSGEYEEVALDDGDMDMFRVLKALKDVGYEGAVNPDHLPTLKGDENNRASLAYAVGYIRGLLSAL